MTLCLNLFYGIWYPVPVSPTGTVVLGDRRRYVLKGKCLGIGLTENVTQESERTLEYQKMH